MPSDDNIDIPEGEFDAECVCDNKMDDAVIDRDQCHSVVDHVFVVDGFDAFTVDDDVIDIVFCDVNVDDAEVDFDVNQNVDGVVCEIMDANVRE